jgi:hypothetical protein
MPCQTGSVPLSRSESKTGAGRLAREDVDNPALSALRQTNRRPRTRTGGWVCGCDDATAVRPDRHTAILADDTPHALTMFVVTEAQAAMIRATYEQRGEFSAAVELRRLFPGITNLAQARECVRTIAGWQPMPSAMPRALPNCGWRIQACAQSEFDLVRPLR